MPQDSSFTPECDEHLKPKLGMTFEGLETAQELYKSFAHHVSFGVRVGQQKKTENQLLRTKWFMCKWAGFMSKNSEEIIDPFKETRHDCDANIFVKICGSQHLQDLSHGLSTTSTVLYR